MSDFDTLMLIFTCFFGGVGSLGALVVGIVKQKKRIIPARALLDSFDPGPRID